MPTTVTDSDIRLARETARRIAPRLTGTPKATVSVDGETAEIPLLAARMLADILSRMGEGKTVALTEEPALSEAEAAEILLVPLDHTAKFLDEGKIPCRIEGGIRRVALADLLDFKRRTTQARLAALEELSALDQELGLGYGS